MENAMIDSIPSSANALIDFAAQLADKRKVAASDGSTASDNGLSETALKLVKLDATILGDEEMKRMSKLFDLMKLNMEKFRLEG